MQSSIRVRWRMRLFHWYRHSFFIYFVNINSGTRHSFCTSILVPQTHSFNFPNHFSLKNSRRAKESERIPPGHLYQKRKKTSAAPLSKMKEYHWRTIGDRGQGFNFSSATVRCRDIDWTRCTLESLVQLFLTFDICYHEKTCYTF